MTLNNKLFKKFKSDLSENIKLSNYSWFNLGGNAEYFYKAKDINNLIEFLKEVKNNNLKTKLVLQVHDELLFEVPNSEVEILKNKVIKEMENACDPFLSLDVPLKVEFGIGENWNSAH